MAKDHVLVTGASGFVGRHLCRRLVHDGYRVRGAVRDPSSRLPAGVEPVVVSDIGPDTSWRDALAGVDAVVHLAARVHQMRETDADPELEYRRVNAGGTERLARCAAAEGVRRLVFVSTVKVNGEATPAEPFRESDHPSPADPYAVTKLEAECSVMAVADVSDLEVVVIRPPLIYGVGVRANFQRLAEVVAKGYPLPLGGIRNQRSLVYVGNLVDAITLCVKHPDAAGETFLVSDGEPVSTPELVRKLARHQGVHPRLITIPPSWLRGVARLVGKSSAFERLESSLVVDDRKIRTSLGWTPPYSLDEGLAETVRSGAEPVR